jgi:16S rRNA (uracil1498-N3)-methyltransferase
MRLTRVYTPDVLKTGQEVLLNLSASNHLLHVLRLKPPAPLIVFDDQAQEFQAQLIGNKKALAQVLVGDPTDANSNESPLTIHLGQAISRSDAMDYSLQKSVELGVNKITPLLSEFSSSKFNADRLDNRMAHWRGVIISACEQSGRRHIPALEQPQTLANWLKQRDESLKLMLQPRATSRLKDLQSASSIALLVGAEGGFSETEQALAQQAQFELIALGPRVLRTETAAPAMIAVLQALWGDF